MTFAKHRQAGGLERDFPFTRADFTKIAQLVYAEAGITLPEVKEPLVYARLSRRLRDLRLDSFAQYTAALSRPGADEERRRLVSALTTNTTRFLREPHHFDLLTTQVLPPLIAHARRGGRVRLWSAACSSGEEAYSIAFSVLALCPEARSLDIRILATDIDEEILAQAREGSYTEHSLANLPHGLADRHFDPARKPGENRCVTADVRALLNFRQMNLIRPWPVKGPFDAVLCRNVVIYFDAATQDQIWHRFEATIPPGGYLFIGHSERLSASVKDRFDVVGMTAYRMRSKDASRRIDPAKAQRED